MNQYLKITLIYIIRIVLRIFHIVPVNEKNIVFISHTGKQYSCNPKYIFQYIYTKYGNIYQYTWCLNNKNKLPANYIGIKTVKYLHLKYCFAIMTAKYIISNMVVEPIFPLRTNQIFVNTWHGGGAYKNSDYKNVKVYEKRAFSMKIMMGIRARMTSYVISSCDKSSFYLSRVWNIPIDKFLPIGLPRNDMFFKDINVVQDRIIIDYLRVKKTKKIVLYAPTFRGDTHGVEEFDHTINVEKVVTSLQNKFENDFIFLYRSHYRFLQNKKNTELQDCISVSNYPDIQELLCAADILITDYSSCMWDFSLMYKPCFIFAPDLKKYLTVQGFYTPIEEWPFPIAETNEQLANNINGFNEDIYIQAVKQHHADLGSYEKGTAAEQFCRILFVEQDIENV